jgi:hypothetical protein
LDDLLAAINDYALESGYKTWKSVFIVRQFLYQFLREF